MARNPQHSMLPQPNADDLARQRYVLALKGFLGRKLRPQHKALFENRAAPAYEARHGHKPETRSDISQAMYENEVYQSWSTLNRTAQELMWETIAETVYRDEPRLRTAYRKVCDESEGSLELDEGFDIPNAIKKINIHLQPGGYARDDADDDVMAGAFYEAGGTLYSRGQSIGVTESKAECIMRFIGERYGKQQPIKILDVACSAGSSSTPYALAFPDAEVHAVDVGPGLLRYAHARAEALGAKVHFHQRSAAELGFEDESFDLIVSHNAMHEMSDKTTKAMMAECYRLLRKGGICAHQDVPLRYADLDEFMRFERGWDLKNNNEPFWEVYANNDPRAMLADAGFELDDIFVGMVPQIDNTIAWFVASAQKQ